MATKKDFSEMKTGRVYDTITEATAEKEPIKKNKPRKEYTPEERLQFMESMKTSGRKGAKMPRINIAFVPEVYEYIKIMSRVRGETMTEFVNISLKNYMEEHKDIYEKAIEFRNSL